MGSGRHLLVVSSCLSACLLVSASSAAQFSSNPSFSTLMPKKVTLISKLPPVYNATGKTVVVQFADANGQLQQRLIAALEKDFTKADSTIQVNGPNPDLLIECKVSQWQDPKYQDVRDSNGSSKQLVGTLSVDFHITELKSQRVVKADTATQAVAEVASRANNATSSSKLLGVHVPGSKASTSNYQVMSLGDAQNVLIDGVSNQISSYLVTTSQALQVPLAVGGALSNPDKFAQGGLWTRDLEELETLPPYSDPRVDVYRLYNIGVANEAVAYQTQDVKAALKYLEQASNAYGKAIDGKPEEKSFIPAQTRIKLALEHYEQIGKFASEPAAAASTATSDSGAGEKPLSNGDIIDMVKAKLDQANILDDIEHATAVNFDLSPQGQIALAKAGVNGALIGAMKNRQRGFTKAPARH